MTITPKKHATDREFSAIVYSITSPQTRDVFIGTLTRNITLKKCLSIDKSNCTGTSRHITKYGDAVITALEHAKCITKAKLSVLKRSWILRTPHCINKQRGANLVMQTPAAIERARERSARHDHQHKARMSIDKQHQRNNNIDASSTFDNQRTLKHFYVSVIAQNRNFL